MNCPRNFRVWESDQLLHNSWVSPYVLLIVQDKLINFLDILANLIWMTKSLTCFKSNFSSPLVEIIIYYISDNRSLCNENWNKTGIKHAQVKQPLFISFLATLSVYPLFWLYLKHVFLVAKWYIPPAKLILCIEVCALFETLVDRFWIHFFLKVKIWGLFITATHSYQHDLYLAHEDGLVT